MIDTIYHNVAYSYPQSSVYLGQDIVGDIMARFVERVLFLLIAAYALWITYQSYTLIPAPPCDWWAFVDLPENPPGMGKPQLALIALLVVIFTALSCALRSRILRPVLFFVVMVPLLIVLLPLIGVVDMEIHGGCVQLGGPEFSRYNSLQSLIFFLVTGGVIYALISAIAASLLFAVIFLTRKHDEK